MDFVSSIEIIFYLLHAKIDIEASKTQLLCNYRQCFTTRKLCNYEFYISRITCHCLVSLFAFHRHDAKFP